MKLLNDADLIKIQILEKIISAFLAGNLEERVNYIPIELRPKDLEPSRCCVYKDRAILRYRIMAALGFGIEDEVDETVPLGNFAGNALTRNSPATNILSVLDIACSGCIESRYFVTQACRGCLARPCHANCPRDAISIHEGHASIDHEKCINCGKCLQVCPYHAIIRIPIPCEEACPTGAISRQPNGKQVINFKTCISCGKCVNVCPFGAVLERSHIIDALKAVANKKTVVAMVAPSIIGQFSGSLHQVADALQQIGFSSMKEVAFGAEETTQHETAEFFARITGGDRLMTSSCCPAYTEAVERHVPELKPFLSTALSPMKYAAQQVKQENADAITVFIGPCIAKKKEAQADQNVDFVLTFEELYAWFSACAIDVGKLSGIDIGREAEGYARGYATSCGVSTAILQSLIDQKGQASAVKLQSQFINGLDRKAINQLKLYAQGKLSGNFLEVMSCEGGCVGGPCTIEKLKNATEAVKKAAQLDNDKRII